MTIAWKPNGNDPKLASAWLRAFLPCKYLQQAGWDCEIFNPSSLQKYKLVIFQKSYTDEDVALIHQLKQDGVKTILDICDNHFYNPENIPKLTARAERLTQMVDIADMVTVSTLELQKLLPSGKRSEMIDDAIDETILALPEREPSTLQSYFKNWMKKFRKTPFKIVWYGNAGLETPPYGMIDIPKILPALEELHQSIPIQLTVISNSESKFKQYVKQSIRFPVDYIEWERNAFPGYFRQHDTCVIPINLNPFTICKTNNRLLLSLLLGLPVVADCIPSYAEFSPYVLFDNWAEHLYQYATQPDLRANHVKTGIEYIHSRYNQQSIVAQWSSALKRVLDCYE